MLLQRSEDPFKTITRTSQWVVGNPGELFLIFGLMKYPYNKNNEPGSPEKDTSWTGCCFYAILFGFDYINSDVQVWRYYLENRNIMIGRSDT